MKILIIRFSSIGDIVLTSPVVRCLKKQLPAAEIHYLTKVSYRDIMESNPYITKVHLLKDNLDEVIPELMKEHFDFIIDLHHNIRSWKVKWKLNVKGNAFNKINLEKWLFVNFKVNIMPVAHIVDRYLETVKDLGVMNDGGGLDYFIPAKDEITVEHIPLTHIHGYVAIAIGAQHATKKLPQEKLKKLCSQLHLPLILIGGKEDFESGEAIRSVDPIKIFNGCGKFSLNQSASIIRQAKAVITHDTGMMHVAAAFKKKIISVWGNTVPEFGMSPYYGNVETHADDYRSKSRIVQVENLSCRPCSKLGYQQCPKKHFKCMNDIREEEIAALLQSV